MIQKRIKSNTTLVRNESTEGETIEMKIERIVENKEPITDGAPTIYTDRRDGVQPAYDIRTDRFEIAIDAMDKVSKSQIATRDNYLKGLDEKNEKGKEGGETPANTSDNNEVN